MIIKRNKSFSADRVGSFVKCLWDRKPRNKMTTVKTGKGHAILEEETQHERKKIEHKVAFFTAKQHKATADTSPEASGIQLSIHALTTFVHSHWTSDLSIHLQKGLLMTVWPGLRFACTVFKSVAVHCEFCPRLMISCENPPEAGLVGKEKKGRPTQLKKNNLWCEDVYPFAKKSTEHNCNPMACKSWKHGG